MTTHFFGDTAVLTGRSLRHITRSPDTIITTAIMPIAMMLLFVYVFGGAINTGSDSYVNYMLPGILLITIASGISYTAFRLFLDMQSGIFERFQSMPIARSSVLWAHVLTSLVANLVSLVLVVLVAFLMGFRSPAGVLAWLAVAGILILFTLALTWIAVIPGLTAKSVDGASAFSYPLIFLPFISSAFVPTATMPGPVRAFAENQPVTSIVNAIRDLFTQQPVGTDIWIALAWCVGILVVAYVFAMGALVSADILGTGWRPVFLVNVPIGLVLLIASFRFLPVDQPERARPPDLRGPDLACGSGVAARGPARARPRAGLARLDVRVIRSELRLLGRVCRHRAVTRPPRWLAADRGAGPVRARNARGAGGRRPRPGGLRRLPVHLHPASPGRAWLFRPSGRSYVRASGDRVCALEPELATSAGGLA
jgi:ABC-2 type transport system permease protein